MKKALLFCALIPLLSSCADAQLSSTSWLASVAVATIVSAFVSGLVSVLLKDKEYKNDYYKKVIDKRIKALEALEACLSLFSSYYSHNEDLCHTILFDDEGGETFNIAVDEVTKYSIWYNKATANGVRAFTREASSAIEEVRGKEIAERATIGVKAFALIEHHRAVLEECIRVDMSSLHKVPVFFKMMQQQEKKDALARKQKAV